MPLRRSLRAPVVGALCLLSGLAQAQWQTQQVDLSPGWNAVYIEVQPLDPDPDALFAGTPVDSAWLFNRSYTPVKYVTNPDELLPEEDDWLAWYPPASAEAPLTDLFGITGGRAYLVELGGSTPFTWNVTGRVMEPEIKWVPESYNFVGFTVSAATPPTFQDFFAPSPAHAGQTVFRLDSATGEYDAAAPGAPMRRGEAFWIYSAGSSTYQGPLAISSPTSLGVDFGGNQTVASVGVSNLAASPRTISAAMHDSATPPDADGVEVLAGPLALSRYVNDPDTATFGYVPISAGFDTPLEASGDLTLTFSLRRKDLVPFTPPTGKTAAYQGYMVFSDGAGYERNVALHALGSGPGGAQTLAKAGPMRDFTISLRHGLWVGEVTADAVSQPANAIVAGNNNPQPVAAKASFRILVHVDASGTARFLQRVFLMTKPGVTVPDPADATNAIVIEPARPVLITNDALLAQFQGGQLVDGKLVGRRISTTAFAFDTPVAMQVDGTGDNTLLCDVAMGYDDPQNPYRHKFHPDHDNMNPQFDQMLGEGYESFDIHRSLKFAFSATDPESLPRAGYGDTEFAGTYQETITGIHRDPINVSGGFRLLHISDVEVLNDGM